MTADRIETTAMNDHDLITDRIYTMAAGDLSREDAGKCATYVLKAIGHRLMPELSDNVTSICLFHDPEGWTCNLAAEGIDDIWIQNRPTPAGAIAGAVNGFDE